MYVVKNDVLWIGNCFPLFSFTVSFQFHSSGGAELLVLRFTPRLVSSPLRVPANHSMIHNAFMILSVTILFYYNNLRWFFFLHVHIFFFIHLFSLLMCDYKQKKWFHSTTFFMYYYCCFFYLYFLSFNDPHAIYKWTGIICRMF